METQTTEQLPREKNVGLITSTLNPLDSVVDLKPKPSINTNNGTAALKEECIYSKERYEQNKTNKIRKRH